VLRDSGQHDLSEWETVTDDWGAPEYYGNYMFANWKDTHWVTLTQLNSPGFSSNTYTNWSLESHHYAQTWVLFEKNICGSLPVPPPRPSRGGNVPCVQNGSPGPLSIPGAKMPGTSAAPARHGVAAKDPRGIVQRTREVRANGTTSLTARCPDGTRVGHAEANLTWPDTPPRGAPDPGLSERRGSATGTIARSALPADGAQLQVLVVCSGDKIARYGTESRLFIGSTGNDKLKGGKRGDRMFAGPGDDRLAGGPADDVMYGGPGDDQLTAAGGSDVLDGARGRDTLAAADGRRTILRGGPGRDRLIGGSSQDNMDAADGEADTVMCGAGRDRVRADRVDSVDSDCEQLLR
jgi:hypothetical protein